MRKNHVVSLLLTLTLCAAQTPTMHVVGKSKGVGRASFNASPNIIVTSLVVTPVNQQQFVGFSVGYTATVNLSTGDTVNVTRFATWIPSNTNVAILDTQVGTQNIKCISAGTVIVKAIYGGLTGQASLMCNSTVPPPPTIQSVTISPTNPSIAVGTSQLFSAIGHLSDGSSQDITSTAIWATSDATIAKKGALATQQDFDCLKAGTPVISATQSSFTGTTNLTCTAVLISVHVTPLTSSILVASTQTYLATCVFNDGSSSDCTTQATWTSSNTSVAVMTLPPVSPEPATGLTAGTVTITATIGTLFSNTTLTVNNPGPPPPTLVSVTVNPVNQTVNVGSTLDYTATCNYSDGSTQDCTASATWASTSPSVATITSTGDPRTATCLTAGTTSLHATFQAVLGTTNLTCQTPTPTLSSIAVTPANQTVTVGSKISYTATCTYSDGSTQNCTLVSQGTTTVWTSNNTGVATMASPVTSPEPGSCIAVGAVTVKAQVSATFGTTTLTCQNPTQPNFGVDGYCPPTNIPTWGVSYHGALFPTTCYNTDPSSTPSTGAVHGPDSTLATVQADLNAAACGDVVEITAGVTLSGTLIWPAKVCDALHYLTLRVHNFASAFPPYGTIRGVSPCYWGVASLPGYPAFNCVLTTNRGATIQSTGTNFPMQMNGPSAFGRIEGIKFTRTAGTGLVSRMIKSEIPNMDHFVFDSDWCANTATDEMQRCMFFDGYSYIAWVNFLVTDMHCISISGHCTANQGFSGGLNGFSSTPDHTWKIVNGFFTSADNTTVGWGGGGANTVPSDIEIRLNWGKKLMIWNPGCTVALCGVAYNGGVGGNPFIAKQSMETKNSDKMFIEANVLDGSWAGFSQVGSHILLTPKNQAINGNNICPLCSVTNNIIRFNFLTTSNNCFQVANVGSDAGGYAVAGNSYAIDNNVCENTNYPGCYKCSTNSGGALDGGDLSVTSPLSPVGFILHDVFVNHNAYIPNGSAFKMGGLLGVSGGLASNSRQMFNFTWTNNIGPKEGLAINNPSDGCSQKPTTNCYCGNSTPKAILDACFGTTGYTFGGNAFVANGTTSWPGSNCTAELSQSSIYVNYNNGTNGPQNVLNYRVKTTSACHNAGNDGLDPGPDVSTLNNRIFSGKVAQF